MQFNVEEVGAKVSADELISFLNDQRRGGFMFVKNYVSETGEIADFWIKGACLYPNMVKRSITAIEDGSLLDRLTAEGLKVTRGTWVDENGIQSNRKAAGRTYQVIKRTYSMNNDADKTVVMTAIASLLQGLVAPKKVDQGFTSVAKGTYVKEGEAAGVVYFRDTMFISKFVHKQGEYEQKASDELPAVKEAIRKMLPIGKYRSFKLAGNFDWVNIEGQSLLQGANIGAWDMALALKEDVQEAVMAPVVNEIVEGMMQE